MSESFWSGMKIATAHVARPRADDGGTDRFSNEDGDTAKSVSAMRRSGSEITRQPGAIISSRRGAGAERREQKFELVAGAGSLRPAVAAPRSSRSGVGLPLAGSVTSSR